MAVIDSNNFITHLVWSGLIDKATCGELKEAIELCTVKDIYTKADMVAMLTEIQLEIEGQKFDTHIDKDVWNDAIRVCSGLIQQRINELEAESEDTCELI